MKIRLDGRSFLNKEYYSGVGNYSKMLSEALSVNNDVEIVSGPLKSRCIFSNYINKIYNKISSYGLALPFDIFMSKINLVIFPDFAMWPTIKSQKKAVVIHDLTYIYYPEFVEKRNLSHLKRVVPRSVKNADIIITVSESVKSELVKEFSINPEKCMVTYIPPDKIYYKHQAINHSLKKKYGIPNSNYILFVGNLEPRKNLVCLIEAYKKLPQDIKSKYKLVIAGSKGWNLQPLTNQLSKDDSKNIILTGFIDKKDMPTLYKMASIFVFPSLYEGFGIPILESMVSGTAVIASDIPVLRETAGLAALYFDPNSPKDLAEKIEVLLSNPNLKTNLVKLGKNNLNRFSWDDNVSNILKLVK